MSAEYKTLKDEAKEELMRKMPLMFQVANEVRSSLHLSISK